MCALGVPSVAAAQSVPVDNDPIEEIVVTGSRIPRRDLTSISPLTTIERSDIELSGRLTMEEVLNRMPQVSPDFGRTSNNPGDGTARVNLRGLGAGRTLVLVNGRRLAPSGVGSAVDVNNLPQALIDRVEIITGGAAAVYGADAVAGVVNFITRDDFEGLSLEGSFGVTGAGDAQTQELSLAYGREFASGRGQLTLYANALEREALFAGDRSFTREALEEDLQGNLFPGGSFRAPELVIFAPADLGNGPVFPIFDPDGNPRAFDDPADRYNFAPVNYLQVPLRRWSAGVLAELDIGDALVAYAELSFANNASRVNLAPVPAGGLLSVNIDNPLLTPATRTALSNNFLVGPNLATFPYGRRMNEVGPRITRRDRDYLRGVVGLRGDLVGNWSFDTWVGVTDASESEVFENDVSASRLAQGVLVNPVTGQCVVTSGGCVPVNPFGAGNISPEAAAFLRISDVENVTERTQTVAGMFVTGTALENWAGPLDIAVGLTWRRDEGDFEADDVLFSGDTLGFRGRSAISGAEEVLEPYAEVLLPLAGDASLARYLGVEAGVRYSDYKLAGGQWTHKFGIDWAPTDSLRFRAMQQRSVRAPNIAELFEAQFEEIAFVTSAGVPDPCSASQDPVGNGVVEKCLIQGLPESQVGVFESETQVLGAFVRGGNLGLQPETADTLTVGFVFGPESAWSLAVDYFDFDVEDAIGQIDAGSICFDPLNTANLFCDNIERGANGSISRIREQTSNRGLLTARGIDAQLRIQAELPAALSIGSQSASLQFSTSLTHLLEYKQQENPVSRVLSCAGRFGRPCFDGEVFDGAQTFPRNRGTATVNYQSGMLSLYMTWQWIQGTDNAVPLSLGFQNTPGAVLAVPDVGSRNYIDLGVGYQLGERTELRLNVNNLFDRSPPLMADAVLQSNTDTGLFDVLGRSFFLSFVTGL